MINLCPECGSNRVGSIQIDDQKERPIWHFICERCDKEWVE